jgi:hypothetical protein
MTLGHGPTHQSRCDPVPLCCRFSWGGNFDTVGHTGALRWAVGVNVAFAPPQRSVARPARAWAPPRRPRTPARPVRPASGPPHTVPGAACADARPADLPPAPDPASHPPKGLPISAAVRVARLRNCGNAHPDGDVAALCNAFRTIDELIVRKQSDGRGNGEPASEFRPPRHCASASTTTSRCGRARLPHRTAHHPMTGRRSGTSGTTRPIPTSWSSEC